MSAPAAGDVIASGKYRLERPLARGGMGSVFVARHLQLDTLVAVKFIDPEMTAAAGARSRFEREARAAAQIRNPHVVQVFDHGVDSGVPYIVMELLEGEDLGTRLKREKRLPLEKTVEILVQLAKGLRRAHDLGIVHRDLKPGNLFMTRAEDEEIVKILDFGLAKAFSSGAADDVTATGLVIGSPQYMSPEQARGTKQLDHRSDLWSVGVILYRCLTGTLPYKGEQLVDLVVKICTEPFAPASQVAPDLPPELDGFFERALARDPERRFPGIRELTVEFCRIAARTSHIDLMVPPSLRQTSDSLATPLPRISSPALTPAGAGNPAVSAMSAPAPLGEAPVFPLFIPAAPSASGVPELRTASSGTTIPLPTPRRRQGRPVLLGFVGGGLAAALGAAGLLCVAAGPETDAPASAPAPSAAESAAAADPGPADPAPTVVPAAIDLDDTDATAGLDSDPDAGASPADAGTDAAARPSGPLRKRRNFGY